MNDAAVLDLWEAALPLPPAARERLLGQAAGASGSASLGEHHAALLRLRQQLFGCAMALRANCPRCAVALDFEIDCARLQLAAPALPQAPGLHELSLGALRVRFRAPCAGDLEALGDDSAADADAVARHLFERCIVEALDGDQRREPGALGAEVQRAVAQRLEAVEPGTDLEFTLDCPDCGTRFEAPLDPAGVLWCELRHRAEQVLADVAALAGSFGWRESEVLALSPARRNAYLQLAGVS